MTCNSSRTTPANGGKPKAKCAASTSNAIFLAAHRRFLNNSYDCVGLRDIAGDAGVDVALVSRYFGNKEALFREVLVMGSGREILPEGMGVEEIPAYLARAFVEKDRSEDNTHFERLLIMLRSSSSPVASRLVHESLLEVVQPIAERIGSDACQLRASLAIAVWMGMAIMQTIMAVEPLCSSDPAIEKRLEALFAAALLPAQPASNA